MSLNNILFLTALLIPLCIDTFILSAALGLAGLPKKSQMRTSLVLAGFEGGMPIIGVLIGHGLGDVLGSWTGYLAAAVIGVAGLLMLKPDTEKQDEQRVKLLNRTKGWSILSLGLAISIDELAVGLSLGLIHVSIVAFVISMVILAFIASRLGLKLGAKLGERLRENAEKAAGIILVIVAIIMVSLQLTGHKI